MSSSTPKVLHTLAAITGLPLICFIAWLVLASIAPHAPEWLQDAWSTFISLWFLLGVPVGAGIGYSIARRRNLRFEARLLGCIALGGLVFAMWLLTLRM